MRHPLPLDGNYLGPAAGEEMQIGGPGDTNYKLRDGGGREGQWAANISSARKIAGGVRFQTHAWRNLESSG